MVSTVIAGQARNDGTIYDGSENIAFQAKSHLKKIFCEN
jgi:hypothetical protein